MPTDRSATADCYGKTLDELRTNGHVLEFQRAVTYISEKSPTLPTSGMLFATGCVSPLLAKADLNRAQGNVRFEGLSGHRLKAHICPLMMLWTAPFSVTDVP